MTETSVSLLISRDQAKIILCALHTSEVPDPSIEIEDYDLQKDELIESIYKAFPGISDEI